MVSKSIDASPAYMGWGTHEFDGTPVFMMQLPKQPEKYRHEFYIDTKEDSQRLHHRMIDTEVEDPAFTHGFGVSSSDEDPGDEGELILDLLLRNRSYWLGFCNVEGETQDEIPVDEFISGNTTKPNDGTFMQQLIHDSSFNEIVKIAKILYVE